MSDGIIQRIARKIRPGSGGIPEAISIVDGQTGRAPSYAPRTSTGALPGDDEDFDDAHSGMPMALSSHYGVGPESTIFPSGTLPGVDAQGNIPAYEPDDPTVLNRLFGFGGLFGGD